MLDLKDLVVHSDPKSPVSEAYRVLRTNIQYSSIDNPLKAIVVTSAGPGEGKTTTTANTAITFAQSGSHVLLIDADLRKPKIHKLFGLNNARGLSNYLATKGIYTDFLNVDTVPGLDILTCGTIPPNPSELLSSKSMKSFIEKVREQYDIVIIDAPPVGAVTDAAILSTISDGTIIVAASAGIEIDALVSAKELLQKVNANLIGVVLNKVSSKYSGGYYYYYEQDEGSEADKKHKKQKIKRWK